MFLTRVGFFSFCTVMMSLSFANILNETMVKSQAASYSDAKREQLNDLVRQLARQERTGAPKTKTHQGGVQKK